MKTIYSTLFEKGQHSFSLQSLMRSLLLCFFIAAATNGQAHEVANIDYELRTDGTAWVKNGKKAQGDVTIPSKIEVDGKEYTVVGINTRAFSSNESITSVTLPENLKYINEGAFHTAVILKTSTISPNISRILVKRGRYFLKQSSLPTASRMNFSFSPTGL